MIAKVIRITTLQWKPGFEKPPCQILLLHACESALRPWDLGARYNSGKIHTSGGPGGAGAPQGKKLERTSAARPRPRLAVIWLMGHAWDPGGPPGRAGAGRTGAGFKPAGHRRCKFAARDRSWLPAQARDVHQACCESALLTPSPGRELAPGPGTQRHLSACMCTSL